MNSMIETLESRTLLSAAPVAAWFTPMQAEMSVVSPAIAYTSPVGTYTGLSTSNQGQGTNPVTIIIQQWNATAGTMQVKFIINSGTIKGIVGIISGAAHRQFPFHFQSSSNQTATVTGKVVPGYALATGTYVVKNLKGVQKDSGTFSVSR